MSMRSIRVLLAAAALAALAGCSERNSGQGGSAAAKPPQIDMAGAQAALAPGETLKTLNLDANSRTTGQAVGEKSTAYAVPVAKGQTLNVTIQASSTSLYMDVVDTADKAKPVHHGEADGPRAIISASHDATYVIRPHLTAEAAKRGDTADFALTVDRY